MSAQTVAYISQAELQSIMPLGLVVRSSMPWMDRVVLEFGPKVAILGSYILKLDSGLR